MAFPKPPSLLLVSAKTKYRGGMACAFCFFFFFPVGEGLGVTATPSLARKRVIKLFSAN